MTYGEAIHLIEGLKAQDGTHTQAAVDGWRWPMTRAAIDLRRLMLAYHNVHRPKEQTAPYELPWPWDEWHAPEVVAEFTALLTTRSAFHTRED